MTETIQMDEQAVKELKEILGENQFTALKDVLTRAYSHGYEQGTEDAETFDDSNDERPDNEGML